MKRAERFANLHQGGNLNLFRAIGDQWKSLLTVGFVPHLGHPGYQAHFFPFHL